MLPEPVSSRRRPRKPSFPYNKPGSGSGLSASVRDVCSARRLRVLFARSRVTNLAVLLLAAVLIVSLVSNVRHWSGWTRGRCGFVLDDPHSCSNYRYTSPLGVKSIEDTIERPEALSAIEHLIIVPGHGIWTGSEENEVWREDKWVLEAYPNQNRSVEGVKARIGTFVKHIRRGVELADEDEKSLLVFSGGSTRPSTPFSESTSYLSLALALSLLSSSPQLSLNTNTNLTTYGRTTTEDHALDSFQNLLFSIARFRAVTAHYPKRITVVGYAFKERRFAELHRAAVRWPEDEERWKYVGIDFDFLDGEVEREKMREEAVKGEYANGYLPYMHDLYGCHDSLLAKRRARNVHWKTHPYHISAPELAPILEWCPPLPHSSSSSSGSESEIVWRFAPDPELEYGWRRPEREKSEKEDGLRGLFDGPLPWDGL